MLSYRHAFHAGNHADILKHSVLVNIFESLNQKDKPYSVFDTHAGSGIYSLDDERALKTNEANEGIIELLKKMDNIDFPESLSNYYKITDLYKRHKEYPGSVEFEKIFTNPEGTHTVFELNTSEIKPLTENLKRAPRILLNHPTPTNSTTSTNNNTYTQTNSNNTNSNLCKSVKSVSNFSDGLKGILSLTPPKIKRGLVLIDPSYEEKNDYKLAEETVVKLHKKWNVGIIALWYPLLAHRAIEIEAMKNSIIANAKAQNENTNIMDARLLVNKPDSHTETSLEENAGPPRLYGSGMLIINFPWKLDEKTKDNLSYITNAIYKNGCPSYEVNMY